MQPGDVKATWARTDELDALIGPRPVTPLEDGMAHFVNWFLRHRAAC